MIITYIYAYPLYICEIIYIYTYYTKWLFTFMLLVFDIFTSDSLQLPTFKLLALNFL